MDMPVLSVDESGRNTKLFVVSYGFSTKRE
jgi:hypothetical protein